ncbi:hypothetical protein B0O80DRAFT_441379 [Mortierella sp. GBAus27b]|nr:hypothetical protein B0O80DRAFT_441379 [Mortierella sp. GBAus27b]
MDTAVPSRQVDNDSQERKNDQFIREKEQPHSMVTISDRDHSPHAHHVVPQGTWVNSSLISQSPLLLEARSSTQVNTAPSQHLRGHSQGQSGDGYQHISLSSPLSLSLASFPATTILPETTGLSQMASSGLTSTSPAGDGANDMVQGQLRELARTLLTVLDTGVKDADEVERIRRMASTALTGFNLTPTPSDDDDDHNDNNDNDQQKRQLQLSLQQQQQEHGLVTPDVTPVSTPVFCTNPRQGSNGQQGGEENRLSTLILPNMMLSPQQSLTPSTSTSADQTRTLHSMADTPSSTTMTLPPVKLREQPTASKTSDAAAMAKKERRISSGSLIQLKNLNPFLTIFGKNTGTVEDQEEEEARSSTKSTKSSWFSTKQRRRSNTVQVNERQGATSSSITTMSSKSREASASTSGSGSESSAYVTAPSASSSTPSSTPSSPTTRPSLRRFTSPLHLPLWSSRSKAQSAPPTPTVAAAATAPTTPRSTAPAVPVRNYRSHTIQEGVRGTRPTISTGPYRQTSSPVVPRQGPMTCTATGSFFDSVSDDDSDTEEEETLYRSGGPRSPTHLVSNPYRNSYYVQQQQHQYVATQLHEHEQRMSQRHMYADTDEEDEEDMEEDESDEDDDDEDEDEEQESDEDEDEDEDEEQLQDSRRGRHFTRSSLEGYVHQFDDAPPPSYHSLIQQDQVIRNRVAPIVPSQPQPSLLVLRQLLDLLHQFEDHVQDQFKTSVFRSHRQAWLDRTPQTVISFAYVLIELEQTGMLSSAMCGNWASQNKSAPTSPTTAVAPPSPSSAASMMMGVTAEQGEMSEQDWLAMAGNASNESHLAKALLALESCCVHGMDVTRWHDGQDDGRQVGRRERWVAQVQDIITAFA